MYEGPDPGKAKTKYSTMKREYDDMMEMFSPTKEQLEKAVREYKERMAK